MVVFSGLGGSQPTPLQESHTCPVTVPSPLSLVPCACNVSNQFRTARHASSTEVVMITGLSPRPGVISTMRALRRDTPGSNQARRISDLTSPLPATPPGAAGLTEPLAMWLSAQSGQGPVMGVTLPRHGSDMA